MKGQLGIGTFEDKKKPILVHSLLPNGPKNKKSSFFVDTHSESKKKPQRRHKEDMPELANITNLPGFSPLASRGEDDDKPFFLLAGDEKVVKICCGPLHSVAHTNRGRIFGCGYGEKYSLGANKPRTTNDFMEIKVKHSGKIEKVEVGCTSTGYIAGGRAYLVGTLGDRTY